MNTQAAPKPKYNNPNPGWWRRQYPKVEVIYTKQTDDNEAYTIFANGKQLRKVSKHTHKKFEESITPWFEFLNWVFGAACFLFAQGVQGTPNPPLNAFISLVWMSLLFSHQKNNKVPPLLSNDANLTSPEDKDLNEKHKKIVSKALIGKYLGYSVIIRRAPFFLIGYFYLVFIVTLFVGPIQNAEPFGTKLSRYFLPDSCTCIVKPDVLVTKGASAQAPVAAKPFDLQHWTGPR